MRAIVPEQCFLVVFKPLHSCSSDLFREYYSTEARGSCVY